MARHRRGAALLEALVALAIIGMLAVAALELLAADLRAAGREPAIITAAALAQDRLAAIRLLQPGDLRRLPDSLAQGEMPAPFGAFRWHATLVPRADDDLAELRVDITWLGGRYHVVTRELLPPVSTTTKAGPR